jgi:hypothetical protein
MDPSGGYSEMLDDRSCNEEKTSVRMAQERKMEQKRSMAVGWAMMMSGRRHDVGGRASTCRR